MTSHIRSVQWRKDQLVKPVNDGNFKLLGLWSLISVRLFPFQRFVLYVYMYVCTYLQVYAGECR